MRTSENVIGRSLYRHALLFFSVLLLARILAIYSVYFYEEDEIALAAGAAALVRDSPGDLYRYTPQLGYYRLVELLARLLGGNVALIPAIMKGLSALSGAVIPTLGLFAFRKALTLREGYLLALTMAINPILWKSSQYGNTAIVSTAVAATSLVILTNRHSTIARIVALGLFGIATLIRADAVLLAPVLLLLLLNAERNLMRAAAWAGGFATVMLLAYGAILWADPRIDSTVSAISQHMSEARETQFWEYLLWAMSPFPLVFSVWGVRSLIASRPALLAAAAVWALPTMFFYFKATTTPRYFLNCVLPLSIAAAVAINEIAEFIRVRAGTVVAWTAVSAVAGIHLFVALGHFSYLSQPFRGAFIITDDRAMPTGALLYTTYFDPNVLARSLPDPEFGRRPEPYWEPMAFTKALELLGSEEAPRRTVIILMGGGWPHAFHYHAYVAGAHYISQEPGDPSVSFDSVTWLEIGNARIMTVHPRYEGYSSLKTFSLVIGDQIWALGNAPFPDSSTISKMPTGLGLSPADSFDPNIRVFDVVRAGGGLP